MNENTFTSTDPHEREIIWSALSDYRNSFPESAEIVSEMIDRVSQTFSWVRNTD